MSKKPTEPTEPTNFNIKNVIKTSAICRAIKHKLRTKVMNIISVQPGITVTQLYVKMRLEQSVVSQHLAILRKAGVVITERNGKNIHYYQNEKAIATLNELFSQF